VIDGRGLVHPCAELAGRQGLLLEGPVRMRVRVVCVGVRVRMGVCVGRVQAEHEAGGGRLPGGTRVQFPAPHRLQLHARPRGGRCKGGLVRARG